MNNLVKNVGIWLVIALVLMTLFNQFSGQKSNATVPYSEFMDQAKQGQVRSAKVDGRTIRWVSNDEKRFLT